MADQHITEGLQKIFWNQLDTEYIPAGVTVNLGTKTRPIRKIYSGSIVRPGYNDTYILLAGGGVIPLSGFTSGGTISFDGNYLPLDGGEVSGDISAISFIKYGYTDEDVLLAGGGVKSLSEFNFGDPFPGFGTTHQKAAYGDHTHNYLPVTGGQILGTLTATTFVKYGLTNGNNYLLLGGGGVKPISDFVLEENMLMLGTTHSTAAFGDHGHTNYISSSGGTVSGGLTGDTFVKSGLPNGNEYVLLAGGGVIPLSGLSSTTPVEPEQEYFPTYTIPTIFLSGSQNGDKEVGESLSQILTLTATKNDGGIFTSLKLKKGINEIPGLSIVTGQSTNINSQFGYEDLNNPNIFYRISYTANTTVLEGNTSWNGIGDFNSGIPKKSSKGNIDVRTPSSMNTNTPQLGTSGVTSNYITINGIYPYFFGKTTSSVTPLQVTNIINSGTGFTRVLSGGYGTLSMSFNAVGEWIWFAVRDTVPTKTAWYESVLNNGEIGDVTDLISSPTVLNVSTNKWSSVSYKIYVGQKVTSIGTVLIS